MVHKLFAFAVFIIFILAINSCLQNHKANELPAIMDDSSKAIIDRSIAYAGGYDVWQKKKTLSFDKKSTSYDTAGKVMRETDTHTDFVMQPEFKAKLTYTLRDTVITVIHDGQKARKMFSGKASAKQNDIDAAWNLSFSSFYNMCMPYKLKDPGSKAEYLGLVTLPEGASAQAIKMSYNKGADSSSDNTWYYYFEPGSGKLMANSQKGKNNYSYTRYNTLEKTNNLLMPGERKAFNVKELNKPGKLVVESTCTNIVFDKKFPADHFKIPDEK